MPMVLPGDCQVLIVRQLYGSKRNQCFQCLRVKIMVKIIMDTYNIAGFTVGFLLHCIERLTPQLVVAHHAGEALHVEDLVHGCAASPFPNNILPTAGTAAKVVIRGRILHVIQHFLGQMFQLIFRPEGRSA